MPEVMDWLDWDSQKFLSFLNMFGGMTLEVPTREELAMMSRNVHIYRTLEDLPGPLSQRRMMELYGLTRERVMEINREVRAEVERMTNE